MLNRDASELISLGHINEDGIKADPSKIKAIVEMHIPNNKSELQRQKLFSLHELSSVISVTSNILFKNIFCYFQDLHYI